MHFGHSEQFGRRSTSSVKAFGMPSSLMESGAAGSFEGTAVLGKSAGIPARLGLPTNAPGPPMPVGIPGAMPGMPMPGGGYCALADDAIPPRLTSPHANSFHQFRMA